MYYSMQRVIMNISMPPEMAKRVKKIAKDENRTQSELVREALRRYTINKDWEEIWAVGRETARKMNIKSYEDIERIAG